MTGVDFCLGCRSIDVHELSNHEVLSFESKLVATSGCRVASDDLAHESSTIWLELPPHVYLVAVVPVEAVHSARDIDDGGKVVGAEDVPVTGSRAGTGSRTGDPTGDEETDDEEMHDRRQASQ